MTKKANFINNVHKHIQTKTGVVLPRMLLLANERDEGNTFRWTLTLQIASKTYHLVAVALYSDECSHYTCNYYDGLYWLHYNDIHKTRVVRCEGPTYTVGTEGYRVRMAYYTLDPSQQPADVARPPDIYPQSAYELVPGGCDDLIGDDEEEDSVGEGATVTHKTPSKSSATETNSPPVQKTPPQPKQETIVQFEQRTPPKIGTTPPTTTTTGDAEVPSGEQADAKEVSEIPRTLAVKKKKKKKKKKNNPWTYR